jgi:hypothetical protein
MKKNIIHIILLVSLFITSSCALKEDITTITKTKSPGILVFEKPSSKSNNSRKYPRDNKQYLSNNDLSLTVSDKNIKKQDAAPRQANSSQESTIDKPKKSSFFSKLFSKSKTDHVKADNEVKKDPKNSGFFSKLFSNTKKEDAVIEPELKKDSNIEAHKKITEKDIHPHHDDDHHPHHKHSSHKKSNASFPKVSNIPATPEHFKDSEKLKNTLKNDLNDLHNELSKTNSPTTKTDTIAPITKVSPVKLETIVPITKDVPVKPETLEPALKQKIDAQTNIPQTSATSDNKITQANIPQTSPTNDNKSVEKINVTPVQLPPPPAVIDSKTINNNDNTKISVPSPITTNDNTKINAPSPAATNDNGYNPIRFEDDSKDPLTIPKIDMPTSRPISQVEKSSTQPSATTQQDAKPLTQPEDIKQDVKPSPQPITTQDKAPSLPSLPLPPQSLKEQDAIRVEVVPVNRKTSFYIPKRYKNNDLINDDQ